jgi:UDP-N-acetylmuramoyl-tripeptide--D-alanyl-D-alanine ligase
MQMTKESLFSDCYFQAGCDLSRGTMKQKIKERLKKARIWYLHWWAYFVLRCRKPKIVAVTGSVGKTTTKELIATVLSHKNAQSIVGLVWKTYGNMNDNEGVSLAVLGFHDYPNLKDVWWLCTLPLRAIALATIAPYPKVLVLEYGAADVIRNVVLAPPHVAIVTAIGPAHLEKFGTVEKIAEEKSALVRKVPITSGLVVLGRDNSYAADMDRYTSARVVKVPGRGRTLSENIACVIAEYFGLSAELARQALAERGSVDRRLEMIEFPSFTMINDCYNANPLSMRLGLDTLSEIATPARRKVAILGMMAELGEEALRYHHEVASYARTRADVVIGVGRLAVHYAPDQWFATSEECADRVQHIVRSGDCVLVKGSFSVELELVVRRLEQIAKESLTGSLGTSAPV